MKIFIYEFKKMWNWRILAMIGVICVLGWFAFLNDNLKSYDSLTTHGIYGSYQNEMFELYGESIDSEELAEYDIPGKKAEVIQELDDLIAAEAIFKEYGLSTYEEFTIFLDKVSNDVELENDDEMLEALMVMYEKLENNAQSLDEFYTSPLTKLQVLTALEGTYINYKDSLQRFNIDGENRTVVLQSANKILNMHNSNLIRYDLTSNFSIYVIGIGVFSVISIMLLIAPYLTIDRMWGVHAIQYSAHVGRKIFRIKFAVTILGTLILSTLLTVLAYIPFMANGGKDYWHTSVMAAHRIPGGLQLYDITFGQYACILAGIVILFNLAAACFTFVLARYSQNIIVMMMKAVPLCLAIVGVLILTIKDIFSDSNVIFNVLFQGEIRASEVIISLVIAIIGLIVVWSISKREKHVDVI